MEIFLLLCIGLATVLGALAVTFGSDSRDLSDHRRAS